MVGHNGAGPSGFNPYGALSGDEALKKLMQTRRQEVLKAKSARTSLKPFCTLTQSSRRCP